MTRNINETCLTIPTSLNELTGFCGTCSCGLEHKVNTKHVSVESGALCNIVPFAKELGKPLKICIVADAITAQIAGNKVLDFLLKDNHKTTLHIVSNSSLCSVNGAADERPHATEDNVLLVEKWLKKADLAVAVGSGTINDLVKLASFNNAIPYITVATAPSMNGYTSAIAAIMKGGIKRTVNCHQPFAVIADLDILSKAPHHLIASGFGDLESKPSSTSDFKLSGILRGTYYCEVPQQVVFAAEKKAADCAEGISQRDVASIRALTEALLLSGFSMQLAGSSSPASGAEHLISHHWDMTAAQENRAEGWHGSQVGVATIVTSVLYEKLKEIDPQKIDIDAILKNRPTDEDLIKQIHLNHGAWAQEAEREYFSKHLSRAAHQKELENIAGNWNDIWTKLQNLLRPGAQVRLLLKKAGAPVNVKQLGLTSDHLHNSFMVAREIRGRFTVLDFAAQLGLLKKLQNDVLSDSGCL